MVATVTLLGEGHEGPDRNIHYALKLLRMYEVNHLDLQEMYSRHVSAVAAALPPGQVWSAPGDDFAPEWCAGAAAS